VAEIPASPTNAITTDEDRLRVVEARLKMLKNLTPDSADVARLELIRDDLKSRLP
jgi:hypothetical protein